MSGAWDPWRALWAAGDVWLGWHDGGNAGETRFRMREISLRRGMDEHEIRCTLAHELVHLERGPLPRGADRAALLAEEEAVHREVVRRLVPASSLGWLSPADSYSEALAHQLRIDLGTLKTAVAMASAS